MNGSVVSAGLIPGLRGLSYGVPFILTGPTLVGGKPGKPERMEVSVSQEDPLPPTKNQCRGFSLSPWAKE